MKKCENCGIILLDPSSLCPLCKTVVTEEHWNGEEIPAVEPVFPYADRGRRRMRFALNIYTYAAIVVDHPGGRLYGVRILYPADFHAQRNQP